MSDNVWSSMFYARGDVPAWHRLSIFEEAGLDPNVTYKAREVLTAFGEPEVSMTPMYYNHPVTGELLESDYQQIIRHPHPSDNEYVPFGAVKKGYELITPLDAAEIWDDIIGMDVETMAFLRRGATLFITGILPPFDVRGDQIENYLILNNPMDGNSSGSGLVSNVRVVCQNTLSLALGNAKSHFRVRHSEGAKERLSAWMKNTYEGALMALEVLQEAYDVLAKTPMTDAQVATVAEVVYRMPGKPDETKVTKTSYEDRVSAWERRCRWANRARSEVVELFQGKGTGLGEGALAGTAWHGFNAFAEFENYRRTANFDSMAVSIIDGDRARNVRKAYDEIVTTVNLN